MGRKTQKGHKQPSGATSLEALKTEVKEGKQKAVGALIGQAKRLNPNVNPSEVRTLCLELIAQQ